MSSEFVYEMFLLAPSLQPVLVHGPDQAKWEAKCVQAHCCRLRAGFWPHASLHPSQVLYS